MVAATAAAAALRARVWDSAACKAWLLAQPYLVSCCWVLYTATRHYAAAVGVVIALAVLVLVWAVVALNPVIAAPGVSRCRSGGCSASSHQASTPR